MKVRNKEMYHYNNIEYNDIWFPGNKIIVDNNYDAKYLESLKLFKKMANITDDTKIDFNRLFEVYYMRLLENLEKINISDEDIYTLAYRRVCIFKRELALEKVRKDNYSNLPSRYHSIYLCDKKGLEFWKSQLSVEETNLDLYKVLVTGNLFKSSDCFIPNDSHNYETILKEAYEYWNPKFDSTEKVRKSEYLFQGEVKILKKVNNMYKYNNKLFL